MKQTLLFLIAVLLGQTGFSQNYSFPKETGLQPAGQEHAMTLCCENSSTTAAYTLPTQETFSISKIQATAGTMETLADTSAEPQKSFRSKATIGNRWYPRYQGEVSFAYGLALGGGESSFYSRIILETVHGARLSQYFFIGGGVGINFCYEDKITTDVETHTISKKARGTLLPLFANAKGYLPASGKIALYLSCDVGAAFDLSNSFDEKAKLYTAVGPGITFGHQNGGTLGDFSVRFQCIGDGLYAMLFRIGVNF